MVKARAKRSDKPRVKAGTSKASAADRRAKFVEAYLQNGGNATQAYRAAGYTARTDKSAGANAAALIADHRVWAEIERRRAEVIDAAKENTKLTVEGVLRELHGVVHSDLRRCFDPVTGALLQPTEWPDDVARGMASVKVVEMAGEKGPNDVPMYVKEVKFWDKNSALEKAMKTLGLLIDRKEVGEPGAFDRMDDDELSRAAAEADAVIARVAATPIKAG